METPADIALAAQNLSPLERKVLQGIADMSAVSSSQMTEQYGNQQVVISATLKKLFDKKLIFREKDPNSKRGFIYATRDYRNGKNHDA